MIPAIAAAINDPSRRAPQARPAWKSPAKGADRLSMNGFSGDINGLMSFW
jgi:hypothetical protein